MCHNHKSLHKALTLDENVKNLQKSKKNYLCTNIETRKSYLCCKIVKLHREYN